MLNGIGKLKSYVSRKWIGKIEFGRCRSSMNFENVGVLWEWLKCWLFNWMLLVGWLIVFNLLVIDCVRFAGCQCDSVKDFFLNVEVSM